MLGSGRRQHMNAGRMSCNTYLAHSADFVSGGQDMFGFLYAARRAAGELEGLADVGAGEADLARGLGSAADAGSSPPPECN